MTPRNLIKSALRAINALGASETPSEDMLNDGKELFNLMLDSWSAERLLPHEFMQTSIALTASLTNYTVGESSVAADRDGVCAAQAAGAAGNLTIAGALATAGVATFDVPRHVTVYAAGANTGVTFAITGTNSFGDAITQTITGPGAGATVQTAFAYKTVTTVYISAASTGDVEVGSGSLTNMRRPLKIVNAFVRSSTGADTPVYICSRERYDELSDKDETGTLPLRLFYDRSYPTAEVYIHPVPTVSTYSLYLDTWLPFVQITDATLDTAINLPGEYILAFRWNLAAELAPEYGRNVSEYVYVSALDKKNIIREMNALPPKPLSQFILATPPQPKTNRN